jgi:aryl-alcohol dehydrogenase-like predicted oxidoreductase
MKRREFLQAGLVLAGGTLFGCSGGVSLGKKAETFDPYEVVSLGRTGLKFSRVGLGTGMNGFNRESNQTRLGKDAFEKLIRTCYERGVNWFDTADIYGSHSFLAPAMKGVPREKYSIVSKIWFMPKGIPGTERPDADVVVERFLKEFQTDYLDLVLIHCMTDKEWTTKYEKQMTLMDKLKQKGVIRAHGVSCHSLPALELASKEPWVDSIHARINPYGASMDDVPKKVVPVLRAAHHAGKGVVGMKIMGAGKFRDNEKQKNKSVDFALNLGCVSVMAVGFESIAELDDFAKRVRTTRVQNPQEIVQNKA